MYTNPVFFNYNNNIVCLSSQQDNKTEVWTGRMGKSFRFGRCRVSFGVSGIVPLVWGHSQGRSGYGAWKDTTVIRGRGRGCGRGRQLESSIQSGCSDAGNIRGCFIYLYLPVPLPCLRLSWILSMFLCLSISPSLSHSSSLSTIYFLFHI